MHLTTFEKEPKTLYDFYMEIRNRQMLAHGDDYCNHHDAMLYYSWQLNCNSYRELGTHQGASAAAMCLLYGYKKTCGIDTSIELVDISFDVFRPHQHLFEEYCEKKEISLSLKEMSSLDPKSANTSVDMLLIDSKHDPKHLKKELQLHSNSINKCIIFHDTTHKPKLFGEIQLFVKNNSHSWELTKHYTQNVGYTVITRK